MIRVEVYVGPSAAGHPNPDVVRKPVYDALSVVGLGDRRFLDFGHGRHDGRCHYFLDFPDADGEAFLAGRLVFEINQREGYCAKSLRI